MSLRARSILAAAVACLLAASCRTAGVSRTTGAVEPAAPLDASSRRAGLLVMAHGGGPAWDRAVGEAVEPMRAALPTALALGMADPVTLQAAVDSLEAEGVTDVAVVRLFLSGASFLHQTQFLLGLRADPPEHPMLHGGGHGAHGGRLQPVRHTVRVHLGPNGLSVADIVPRIVADRATSAAAGSKRPVLVLAHGMGDESENEALIANMQRTADTLRAHGFHEVSTATLREDWPEARARSEQEIRDWLDSVADPGTPAVVVPYRVFGFGPYAEVLGDRPYEGTDGLLPHPLVATWIRSQAAELFCAQGIATRLAPCSAKRPEAEGETSVRRR
jgi:sirohydrochlorin ferrochelatase